MKGHHVNEGGLDKSIRGSSCSQRARLVYIWVQDEGGDRGWSLWAIGGTKVHVLPR